MMESPTELAQRWRERASELDQVDWSAAYHLRFAADELDSLGMELESHPNVPVSVAEYHSDGSPIMDERWVPPIHKHHFEWVTKERWVTPWREVGLRETSEQLSARLEANRT